MTNPLAQASADLLNALDGECTCRGKIVTCDYCEGVEQAMRSLDWHLNGPSVEQRRLQEEMLFRHLRAQKEWPFMQTDEPPTHWTVRQRVLREFGRVV